MTTACYSGFNNKKSEEIYNKLIYKSLELLSSHVFNQLN